MQARLIYLLEYSYALGLIRRDSLPELMGDATGYRLGSITKPSTNEAKVREWRKELKRRWENIIENYPSTPWALLARREKETALGLEWRLSRE
jgi:hypothetical protein